MTTKTFIIGNWKQNPENIKKAVTLAKGYVALTKNYNLKTKNLSLGIAVPFPFLSDVIKTVGKNKNVSVYAQDVSAYNGGAHTGEVSPTQLASVGIKNVIIGHSEKRIASDTNKIVAMKVENALQNKMCVTLCVGEEVREKEGGAHLAFVREQLNSACKNVSKFETKNLMIVYEPVWAIGKNAKRVATTDEIHEMAIFIKRELMEIFGKATGNSIPILYGGSANGENTKEIFNIHHINGLLLGRASLDIKEMARIIKVIPLEAAIASKK